MRPDIDDLVVPLARRDGAALVLFLDGVDFLFGRHDFLVLLDRDNHVVNANGNTRLGGFLEAQLLELVERLNRLLVIGEFIRLVDEITQLALAGREIRETQFVRPNLAEHHAPSRGLDHRLFGIAVHGLLAAIGIGQENARVVVQVFLVQREKHLVLAREHRHTFFFFLRLFVGQFARVGGEIVTAQGDVLRGRHDRLAAGRAENVVCRDHQQPRLHLRLHRERHVYRHLVAVKVRVVRRANQRVNANRLALNERRHKCLHRKPVQRRGAVEQHGVIARHFLEHIPHLGRLPLDEFLRRTHGVHVAQLLEPANDERLEEHERHFLRQPALVQF